MPSLQNWRSIQIQIFGGFLLNYVAPVTVVGKLIGLAIGVIGLGNLAFFLVREAKETKAFELIHWLFMMITWTTLLILYAGAGYVVQRFVGSMAFTTDPTSLISWQAL